MPATAADARLAQATPTVSQGRLSNLSKLADVDIETPMVKRLSKDLHKLFDPVSDDVLPIYYGPLLGRLYLAGL